MCVTSKPALFVGWDLLGLQTNGLISAVFFSPDKFVNSLVFGFADKTG
jgi:hypothetical protein